MSDEIYRPIAETDGRFSVSNKGNVRRNKCRIGNRNYCQKDVTPVKHAVTRYVYVCLHPIGKRAVHRLVLSAFCRMPNAKEEGNHKNGIRDDNRIENLEWVSSSENKKHAHAILDRKQHCRTIGVILRNAEETLVFESELSAAIHLGVDAGSVRSALKRNHRTKGYTVEMRQ